MVSHSLSGHIIILDMDRIEHIWFELKMRVYKVNQDIDNLPGGDEKVRKETISSEPVG